MGNNVTELWSREKPVSIKTLKKKEIDKIMKAVAQGKAVADDYYRGTIEGKLLEREQIYNADKEHYRKKFPRLSEMNEWVSKDVKTSIGWIIPSVMEVFTGAESPVSVRAGSLESLGKAKKIEQLLRYQLDSKNDYTTFCNDIWMDSFKLNYAVAKVWWNHEEKRNQMQVMISPDDFAVMNFIGERIKEGAIEVTNVKELDGGFLNVEYDEITVTDNYPVVERIPPSELRFSPESGDIQKCKFVAHRKIVKGDYLKRKEQEGIYENVDKAIKYAGNTTPTNYDVTKNKELNFQRLDDGDIASKDVELYECYVNVDYNNDGIYEKLIVHTVGDSEIPIKIQENDFKQVPFFVNKSERNPAQIFNEGESFADLIEQQQDLKTAVIRQMIINIAKANHPQVAFDQGAVDVEALLDNEDLVPVKGFPNTALFPITTPPLSGATMTIVDYAQNEIESQTGSTRYNQGLDSGSLNRMLALDTPIPMADGSYKNNGDIVAGDMVIGRNGKPTEVLIAHPVQMPERAFEISFENGDVVKAGGEHLWAVKIADPSHQHYSEIFEKLPTERIYELMQSGHKIHIPRVAPVEYDEKDLFLDPYILGAWLGNGNAHTNRFTSMDKEVIDAFDKWAKGFYKGHIEPTKQQRNGKATTYQVVNTPLREMLKDLHCLRDHRYEDLQHNVKHIPDMYLHSSIAQRYALLRGLMDTDGCITKDGTCLFCNSEPALVETFVQLVASLGGQPSVHWRMPNNKIGDRIIHVKPNAHVTFALQECPVSLPYKVERWRKKKKNYGEQSILSMVEIPVEPMRCLTVDADDKLYCCGKRFTVTSNTATGLTAILGMADKKQKNVARLSAENFFKPMFKFIIRLNQRYGLEQSILIGDQNVSISPEDLDIDYDLTLNVGQGAGTKEIRIQYIMVLLGQILPILSQAGIADENTIYTAAKALVQEMGLMNVEKVLVDPSSDTFKRAQAQKQQMQLASVQAEKQAEIMGKKAVIDAKAEADMRKAQVPKVATTMDDLPMEAQMQLLERMGLKSTPEGIAIQNVLQRRKT